MFFPLPLLTYLPLYLRVTTLSILPLCPSIIDKLCFQPICSNFASIDTLLNSRRYARVRLTGGKGTPRRKVVKKSQSASQGDDRKLQAALKKLNVTAVGGVEEVNMFKEDGNVLHFQAPRGESLCLLRPLTSSFHFFHACRHCCQGPASSSLGV